MTATAIGIDIGGTHIRAARVTPDGRIEARVSAPSAREAGVVLERCCALFSSLRNASVRAIGVGAPGQVDADGRRVMSGGFVDLSAMPFVPALETRTGLPVRIENDATMALLGEVACGAARGHANVVLLTIGTGIGGAILDRGRVLRGSGMAGQLGHIVVQPDGLACVCGRRGCVETVSSGRAFGMHLHTAGLSAATRVEDLLARPGDASAQAVLAAWADPLGQAIETLIAIANPGVVLLGGGAGAGAAAALAQRPGPRSWFSAPVRAAALGDDAGMIGAGVSALGQDAPPSRVVLVNGVPASGKSRVASALGMATGWPVLSLDTIKEPFLHALAPVDRAGNRTLGRAAYGAMFGILRDAPPGGTFVLDAWFGFRPEKELRAGLEAAGIRTAVEIWCTAPPEVVASRYAARSADRAPGHPGPEYASELAALARTARPLGQGPVRAVDTTIPIDAPALLAWIEAELSRP